MFLTNPTEWRVLCPKAVAYNSQIFMVLNPLDSEPLLKFYLRDVSLHKNLLVPDLKYLGLFLDIPHFVDESAKMLRKDMIHALLDFVGKDDCDYIAKVKEAMERQDVPKKIGGALDEIVLGELPGEDQGDFKEIAKQVECNKKIGWSIVEQEWKKKVQKPKAKAKGKAKAKNHKKAQPKVKAKAKGFAKRNFRKRPAEDLPPAPEPEPAQPPPDHPDDVPGEPVAAEPVDPPFDHVPPGDDEPVEILNRPPPVTPGRKWKKRRAVASPNVPDGADLPPPEPVAAEPAVPDGADLPPHELVAAEPPVPDGADLPPHEPPVPDGADLPHEPLAAADGAEPVAADPPADGAAGPAEPRPPAVVHRDYINQWEDVMCDTCHRVAGQIKLDPGPGNRDEPTWFMRVRDAGGKWGSKYPLFRRRVTNVIGQSDEGPRKWVQDTKSCCRG